MCFMLLCMRSRGNGTNENMEKDRHHRDSDQTGGQKCTKSAILIRDQVHTGGLAKFAIR